MASDERYVGQAADCAAPVTTRGDSRCGTTGATIVSYAEWRRLQDEQEGENDA